MNKALRGHCVLAGAAIVVMAEAHAASYHVVDLGLGDSGPINDLQVMGASDWLGRPQRWDGHRWQPLRGAAFASGVLAIDGAGDLGGATEGDAAVWRHGQKNYTLLPGGSGSAVQGLTDDGRAVGTTYNGGTCRYWDAQGNASSFGAPGYDFCYAYGINSNGEIALTGDEPFGHGFHLQGGVYVDIGTLGGSMSAAYAINSSGHIAGVSTDANSVPHGVLWKDGVLVDLGEFDGFSSVPSVAMNDADVVVGYFQESMRGDAPTGTDRPPFIAQYAVIFQGGRPVTLDSLTDSRDWNVRVATGIANDGTIAATGVRRIDDVGERRSRAPLDHILMLVPIHDP